MTVAADDSSRPSPWLTVWLKPRDTIERIVATNPRRHVLPLAAIAGVSDLFTVSQWISAGAVTELLDWRFIAIGVVAGSLLGIIGLYYSAILLTWVGRILGGHATASAMRAVVAWGRLPSIAGFAICLVALGILKLSGSADISLPASRMTTLALPIIEFVFGFWSLIAATLMFARIQRFGFWGGIAGYPVFMTLVSYVLALTVRTFLYQSFSIPSGSMVPTLLVGDYLFVSKFAYGYSHYSLPFSPPLFSGRIFATQPQRGDVVVFTSPKGDSTIFVKRIVGLPGDRIQMIDGRLNINGAPVERERIDDFIQTDETGKVSRVKQWRLTLPNGVSYDAIDLVDNGFYDNTPVYDVPPGNYFVLGDNLDNSVDSRIPTQMGYVPFEKLIGRAAIIFWSADQTLPAGQPNLRSDRIGTTVR